MRDFQKNKVYEWEDGNILPKIHARLDTIEKCQTMVDYMWTQMNRINPPTVYLDKSYKTKSTGNRYKIRLMESMIDMGILVHEMAHSYNLCEDRNVFDIHGPNYVADYIAIVSKFFHMDAFGLIASAEKEGVKVNRTLVFDNLSKFTP